MRFLEMVLTLESNAKIKWLKLSNASSCKNVVICITFFCYQFYIFSTVHLLRHAFFLPFVLFVYLFKALWLTDIIAETQINQLRTCNPRKATWTAKVNEDTCNYVFSIEYSMVSVGSYLLVVSSSILWKWYSSSRLVVSL